jgi:Mg-chelatase subunit ChlI
LLLVSAVAAPERLQAKKRPAFPFTRLAGQEDMKLALLLNVVDSSIGGVLIMGDRGTGKSVAVRSLVDLLPMIDVVQEDPFNSHPTGACGSHKAGSCRTSAAAAASPSPAACVCSAACSCHFWLVQHSS